MPWGDPGPFLQAGQKPHLLLCPRTPKCAPGEVPISFHRDPLPGPHEWVPRLALLALHPSLPPLPHLSRLRT